MTDDRQDGPVNVSGSGARQNSAALKKNQDWFADNDWYKNLQQELELYRFIALSAAHETRHARRLLDIGNGGVFTFPIAHIPEVVALDVFVEASFRERYPAVEWVQASALDMRFDRPFDTIIEINTLHHIIGDTVAATYRNLDQLLESIAANLEPGGRAVIIESTVPKWFLAPYKTIFPILLAVWPLKHPPTFQFHFRDIMSAAEKHGLSVVECCWIPKTSAFMTLGIKVRPWMSPIQVAKLVFSKA